MVEYKIPVHLLRNLVWLNVLAFEPSHWQTISKKKSEKNQILFKFIDLIWKMKETYR